jgi:hypothetical protein
VLESVGQNAAVNAAYLARKVEGAFIEVHFHGDNRVTIDLGRQA